MIRNLHVTRVAEQPCSTIPERCEKLLEMSRHGGVEASRSITTVHEQPADARDDVTSREATRTFERVIDEPLPLRRRSPTSAHRRARDIAAGHRASSIIVIARQSVTSGPAWGYDGEGARRMLWVGDQLCDVNYESERLRLALTRPRHHHHHHHTCSSSVPNARRSEDVLFER